MNKITEQIWLGDSSDAREPGEEVNAILNCAFDLANPHQWNRLHLAHCGLIDGPGNPMSAYYSAVAQLAALASMGKKVLVHCHKGESRSAGVVICYLAAVDIQRRGWDYWRDFIHQRRPLPDGKPEQAHRDAFHNMDWLLLRSVIGE